MNPIAQRVAEAVYRNGPAVGLCFTCVAAQQGLKEHDVRGAALVLMICAGLRVVRRACSSCRRVDDVLVAQNVA
jgi:hypothetical protein